MMVFDVRKVANGRDMRIGASSDSLWLYAFDLRQADGAYDLAWVYLGQSPPPLFLASHRPAESVVDRQAWTSIKWAASTHAYGDFTTADLAPPNLITGSSGSAGPPGAPSVDPQVDVRKGNWGMQWTLIASYPGSSEWEVAFNLQEIRTPPAFPPFILGRDPASAYDELSVMVRNQFPQIEPLSKFVSEASGLPSGVPTTPAALHRWAGDILHAIAGDKLTPAGLRLARAIAYAESLYGVRGSFLIQPGDVPSNNWGACVAIKGQDSFSHADHALDGTPVTYKFARFATPEDGAKNFMRAWGQPDTLAAANAGDVHGMALAMFKHGYYGGFPRAGATPAQIKAELGTPADTERRVNDYVSMVRGAAAGIDKALAGGPASTGDVPWWEKPGTPASSPPRRIMFVGDSIVVGVVGGAHGFRKPIREALDAHGASYAFVGPNASSSGQHDGFGGATMNFISKRIDHDIETYKPDDVVLEISTNDLTATADRDALAAQYDALVKQILAHPGVRVVAVAIPAPNKPARDWNARIADLTFKQLSGNAWGRLTYVPLDLAPSGMVDAVHPNDIGYAVMAQNILDGLTTLAPIAGSTVGPTPSTPARGGGAGPLIAFAAVLYLMES